MLMMPLGDGEVSSAQTVCAEQVSAVGPEHLVARCTAEARPARRVELLDDRLYVERRLLGRDRAAGGGDGQHIQRGVFQRQAQGHGVIDAGVDIEDDFSGHQDRIRRTAAC